MCRLLTWVCTRPLKDHFSKSMPWQMGPLTSSEHLGLVGLFWGLRGLRLLRGNLSGHLPLLVPESVFPFSDLDYCRVLAGTKGCPQTSLASSR